MRTWRRGRRSAKTASQDESGRDDESDEGDNADGCDAVRLVCVDGDRDRGGTAREVRAGPGQLQPAKVSIPKDSREERAGLG